MRNFKPFRNLFYQRAGRGRLLVFLCPPDDKLIIDHTTKIGSGLLLYHPYSTIINAKEIGDNCIIRHLTTLGNIDNDNTKRPIIKNNVDIGCNVIILGAVEIGNNCKIGAGSVVTKNVPDNCVVVGNPAYIIKNDGVKVRQEL
ncbi:MAG: serine acetyltransferase [Prolixibacteraceae bacterium]|nr:serine acetyltransferase [Prolixibacteraceae bacterium]